MPTLKREFAEYRSPILLFATPNEKEEMTGETLTDAIPGLDTESVAGGHQVSLTFNNAGGVQFGRVTEAHVGEQLGAVIDGRVKSAPVINEPIYGGRARISGRFTFEDAQDIAVAYAANHVVAADMDFDERIDLVTAHTDRRTCSVLLNRGNGMFVSAASYPAGLSPFAAIVVDVNVDGYLDLVTSSEANSAISVLLATDDGINFWTGGLWAADLDMPLLIVNHATAEKPVMQAMTRYLKKTFPGILAEYIDVKFPYSALCNQSKKRTR